MRWTTGLIALVVATSIATGSLAQSPPLWATVPAVPALTRPERSGFVEHEGARLYFAIFNSRGGSPVLLLHGGFASSESWGFEVPRLAANHEVIVMDTRGHGRSTLGAEHLSYRQFASDAIAVLDAAGVRKASILGASDGGITGLLLAIERPERVDKLFIWGANFNTKAEPATPPDPAMKDVGALYIAQMEAQYRAISPTPQGFEALRNALRRLYATEPALTPKELSSIQAPTVVADGAHEQFIAPDHTATLAKLIPDARLVILRDVSHGGPQQDPAGFHALVAQLLDTVQ